MIYIALKVKWKRDKSKTNLLIFFFFFLPVVRVDSMRTITDHLFAIELSQSSLT